MLSDKVTKALESIVATGAAVRELIEEETNGVFGLCYQPYVQLWANPEHQHDLKDLETLVGPVKYAYTLEGTDAKAYSFKLGKANGIIIMPPNTSDSRGESDDVSTNTEA